MNIAILGIRGSKLAKEEREKAIQEITKIVDKFKNDDLKIMTMHTPNGGVNTLVEMMIQTDKLSHALYDYGHSIMDWKEANRQLAQDCDVLFCLTTGIKKDKCHHCLDYTHESSGGCFALKEAKALGKKTKLIILR